MAKLRCRLCGGKLVNNRCTFCGLDNSCYGRDRTYQKTFSDQRRVERSAGRGTPAHPVQPQPVRQGSVRPAAPSKTAAPPRSVYRKTESAIPGKSGRIAWITVLIIILCAFISFLRSGGFTLPDSFGAITSDGTYSDPSGGAIDWDPYTGVTRDIPADGETYETVLGTGAYRTGIHLPEGEYRAGTGASEIPEGIYDISIAEDESDPFGYASITLLYPNGLSGYYWADSPALATDAEGYTSAGVKNVVIPDGTEISVTYGDIVLTPGQACYDVDYTDYPQQ